MGFCSCAPREPQHYMSSCVKHFIIFVQEKKQIYSISADRNHLSRQLLVLSILKVSFHHSLWTTPWQSTGWGIRPLNMASAVSVIYVTKANMTYCWSSRQVGYVDKTGLCHWSISNWLFSLPEPTLNCKLCFG